MPTVAVIGAGFSGTIAACRLARDAAGAFRVALVERAPRFARGAAYGVNHHACLLNVPAGRMSAFPEEPEHFLRWLRARDPRATGGTFPARSLYGEYLGVILAETERAPQSSRALDRVPGEAVRIDPPRAGSPARIHLRDGRTIDADGAILALGNFPPGDPPLADPAFFRSARYARDPWAPGVMESVPPNDDVLLLGTGLTMLDVALALKASGHSGTIHAISRRGLLPQPHRISVRPPRALPFPEALTPMLAGASASAMLRALRDEIRRGARAGDDWREVVTALRGDTPALWRALDDRSKLQFLRHLQPYWDTHRHRAAPETAAGVADLLERGELTARAGRVESITETARAAEVSIVLRASGERTTVSVGRVINCTGPQTNPARCADPLLASALEAGLLRVDPFGLGLDADDAGRALSRDGRAHSWLFLVGPLRRGQLWETTAVPELRTQARDVAQAVARAVPVASSAA